MAEERAYVLENTRQRERLRALVERLSDEDLLRPVNEDWTVAAALAHLAFWDARCLYLADKIDRGLPFTLADVEPEGMHWVNDASRPLCHAIPPREAALLALRTAEAIDQRVAELPPERLWPEDPDSLLNAFRAEHRGEHLDEIEGILADPFRVR